MTRCRCPHRDLCLHTYISGCGCIHIQRRASLRTLLARLLGR